MPKPENVPARRVTGSITWELVTTALYFTFQLSSFPNFRPSPGFFLFKPLKPRDNLFHRRTWQIPHTPQSEFSPGVAIPRGKTKFGLQPAAIPPFQLPSRGYMV
jgi:hypothetical protein